MKISSKKGSNKITFILTERSYESKIKALQRYKCLLPARKINAKNKKILGVFIVYKFGYSCGRKIKSFFKDYTDKNEAERVYRMGLISEITNKKGLRGEDYSWSIYKGRTTYRITAVSREAIPEYYTIGYKFPSGNKITQKALMKFLSTDVMEKADNYGSRYDKPHNLRSITLTFIYEDPTKT